MRSRFSGLHPVAWIAARGITRSLHPRYRTTRREIGRSVWCPLLHGSWSQKLLVATG